jgi:hypothetical protein
MRKFCSSAVLQFCSLGEKFLELSFRKEKIKVLRFCSSAVLQFRGGFWYYGFRGKA